MKEQHVYSFKVPFNINTSNYYYMSRYILMYWSSHNVATVRMRFPYFYQRQHCMLSFDAVFLSLLPSTVYTFRGDFELPRILFLSLFHALYPNSQSHRFRQLLTLLQGKKQIADWYVSFVLISSVERLYE